jgi:hypothetical protein
MPGSFTSEQRERLREGIALFNRGEFFECHEVLEGVWMEASGGQKTLLQGLIQVAVAFYHLRRANFIGSSRLLRAGLEKLSQGADLPEIADLEALLKTLTPLPDEIQAGRISPTWPAPSIRWHLPAPQSEPRP